MQRDRETRNHWLSSDQLGQLTETVLWGDY